MSTVVVPDLSARASARLGSRYQLAALTRRSPHPAIDRYQPLRTPWAHAFWPRLDHRLGKLAPADAVLAEAIAEAIAPEHQADVRALFSCPLPLPGEGPLDYNRRLVSPELGLSVSEQRRCAQVFGRLAPQLRRPGEAPRAAQAPTPLEPGGVVSVPWVITASPLTGIPPATVYRTMTIPAPVHLVALSIDTTMRGNSSTTTSVRIPAIGLDWVSRDCDTGTASLYAARSTLPLDFDLTSPAGMEVEINTNLNDTGGTDWAGTVLVSYRWLPGRRSSAALSRALAPAAEVEVSPLIQLDPSIAAAFDAAMIPDEWYITRPGEPLALP